MDVLMDSTVIDEGTVHEAIVRRARELWEQRGRVDGHAEEDWAQAEAEVRQQLAQRNAGFPAFLAVKANGYIYTCRYDRNSDAYKPGDLAPGETIRLRFEGEKIYMSFRDHELETTIVRRAGRES
jgi:Protein of unknown function (DUF2934)